MNIIDFFWEYGHVNVIMVRSCLKCFKISCQYTKPDATSCLSELLLQSAETQYTGKAGRGFKHGIFNHINTTLFSFFLINHLLYEMSGLFIFRFQLFLKYFELEV